MLYSGTRIATTKRSSSFVPTTVVMQPQLQPALLRVSATIPQYFTRFDSASFAFHTVMTKCALFQLQVLPVDLNRVPSSPTKSLFVVLIVESHVTQGIETNNAGIDKGAG